MKKQYRPHLIAIALYVLLTLLLTWPLARYVTSHIPGEATWAFDESTFIWNMWWLKFSVLNQAQTPLESTHTFFPLGISLTTYTFNLFNAAFGLPLQLAFSLPLANNLSLIFSYVSSAYGTFLLVLYLLRQSKPRPLHPLIPYLAAFVAGTVFAFSASRMMYVALGHYNFVTIQWFPFYALFLLKALREGTKKTIIPAGLFAAFCLYAELTYSVFLLFLTLIIFINKWPALRKQKNATRITSPLRTLLPRLFFIALTTFILSAPFILSVLRNFLDPAFARPGWGEGLKLSADLAGLLTVTPLHPFSGLNWITELRAVIEGSSRFSDANTLFLGYGILAMALLGFIACRKVARVWVWSAILFTALSLGPLLTINGQNRFDLDGIEVTFPLPFALLHYIPVLSANRVPNRFSIPLTLSLAVLVGYGVAWLLAKIGGGASQRKNTYHISRITHHVSLIILALLFLGILLFDQFSPPIPLTDARIPEVYHQIGAEPDEFTVMHASPRLAKQLRHFGL